MLQQHITGTMTGTSADVDAEHARLPACHVWIAAVHSLAGTRRAHAVAVVSAHRVTQQSDTHT